MAKMIIHGGNRIEGTANVQAAKNAALPLLAASILTEEEVVIENCPHISDVDHMIEILKDLGCKVVWEDGNVLIRSECMNGTEIPQKLAKVIRSSIFLLGPILGRFRRAKVAYPGGCDIGMRPIDQHLAGLRALDVSIDESAGYIECDGRMMRAGTVIFDCPSVGATENTMMAAVLSAGKTIIRNAAKEPEIVDLQNFLNAMGANVKGAGSSTIEINGVKKLHGTHFRPLQDRIVAGTLLISAAITGGEIELFYASCEHICALISKLSDSACKITSNNGKIYLKAPRRGVAVNFIRTMPYPGFPTDLQAQMLAYACVCDGMTIVEETLFETRFKHAAELLKMGARINVRKNTAIVSGVPRLHGAEVTAHDLRGGAALILAGLAAEGETVVSEISHVDRGYESIERTLTKLGANVKRQN